MSTALVVDLPTNHDLKELGARGMHYFTVRRI